MSTDGLSPRQLADLTPVENRGGLWVKREDLHVGPGGVNGAKLRACQYLIGSAAARGATSVVSASSVLSPQAAMAAAVARDNGMTCRVIVGGTTVDKAVRHTAIRLAVDAGATLEAIAVGYNPALQKAARDRHRATPGSYWLRYGITAPAGSTPAECRAFHEVGADQVLNLPPALDTLIIPFGSGNTAAGVLTGIATHRPARLRRVVLVGIGPNRVAWLTERLRVIGATLPAWTHVEHLDLHGTGYTTYQQKMPGNLDGITLHPTYEGKVVRYLDETAPDYWTRRDGTTCLWIVGGPLPRKGAAS